MLSLSAKLWVYHNKRAEKWRKFCCDPTVHKYNGKWKFVCDLHFPDSDFFYIDNKFYLSKHAIPSLNGPKTKVAHTLPKKPHDEGKVINPFPDVAGNGYSFNNIKTKTKCEEVGEKSLLMKNAVEKPFEKFQKHLEALKKHHSTAKRSYQWITEDKNIKNITKNIKYQKLSPEIKGKKSIEVSNNKFSDANRENEENVEVVTIMSDNTNNYMEPDDVSPIQIENTFTLGTGSKDNWNNKETFPHPFTPKRTKLSLKKNLPKNLLDSENQSNIKNSIDSSPPSEDDTPAKRTISIIRPRANPVESELAKVNEIRRRTLLKKYKKREYKRKYSELSVRRFDPSFSIGITAKTMLPFSPNIEPVEMVKLNEGHWWKLYTPGTTFYEKVNESNIEPMVNQLRTKIQHLGERDRLEVLFLLSMMSVYPNAPKRIKELLLQRLNFVYIAVMFKWDTALALAAKLEEKAITDSKANYSELPSNFTKIIGKTPNGTPKFLACSVKKEDKSTTTPELKKRQFAFEIIISKQSSSPVEDHKTTEGEFIRRRLNT